MSYKILLSVATRVRGKGSLARSTRHFSLSLSLSLSPTLSAGIATFYSHNIIIVSREKQISAVPRTQTQQADEPAGSSSPKILIPQSRLIFNWTHDKGEDTSDTQCAVVVYA